MNPASGFGLIPLQRKPGISLGSNWAKPNVFAAGYQKNNRQCFSKPCSYYNLLCVGNRQSEYALSKYSLGIKKMS